MHERNNAPTFEELYEAYGERILNVAYRLTANEEISRDLTQEIFIKIYENLDRFEHKSHVYTWIYRVAVNHILNYLKRERRYKWLDVLDTRLTDILHQRGTGAASGESAADKRLEESQRMKIVWDAIRELPAKYRVPFVLFHWEGMSYREIAETMELGMSAVESRIHRAKKRLIEKLKPWIGKI